MGFSVGWVWHLQQKAAVSRITMFERYPQEFFDFYKKYLPIQMLSLMRLTPI